MKAGTVKNKRDFSVKRIFRLVNSHVKIKVSGVNAEKFINICLRRNIDIWDVERGDGFFSLCMSIKAFKRNIRQIARKTGCKVKITERSGALIVMSRYKFRIPLALYLFLTAIIIYYCSTLIWDVNISAIDDESMEAARHILKSFGVYPGASMHDIDTKEISMKLVLEIENIKWANVYKNGTVINVELLPDEKYADDESEINGARDLVSQKDALIKKIVVERGTAEVAENTVVLSGETLISGLIYPIDEMYGTEPRLVSAKGEVIGVVRYSASAPVETKVKSYALSGSTAVKKSIEILGRRFTVPFLSSGDNFKSYNTVVTEKKLQLDSRHKLPISIVTEERSETAEFETVLSKEAAEKYALLEAMQVLDNKIPDDAKIIKTGKEMREIDGVACVYIWAECEEKIGEYVRRDKLPDAVNPDKG